MRNLEQRIKREIIQVEKEMNRAVNLDNHSYAQSLYFQDLLPLIKTLNNI